MQFTIGIDIAKTFNYATIIDNSFNQLIEPFKFYNTIEGFEYFISTINKSLSKQDDFSEDSDVLIVMESTGHYQTNFFSYLKALDYKVGIINPIQTDSVRKQHIRKTKNDKVDSFLVAKTALINGTTDTFVDPVELEDLKKLTRLRQSYTFKNSQLKVQLHGLLDLTFPEYPKFFSDTYSNTSLHLLEKCQSASDFAKCDIRTLTNIATSSSRGKTSRKKMEELKELAKSSAGSKDTHGYTYLISLIATELIQHLKTLKELDAEIELIMEKLDSPITTIPGIGNTTGAIILSEIGDISKFDAPKKIVAYAGLDASVNESGNFVGTKNKISKRGSTELRNAFYSSAFIAWQVDPVLNEFYLNLRARGKPHRVAVIAVARKLVNITYSVLKNNKSYEIRQ